MLKNINQLQRYYVFTLLNSMVFFSAVLVPFFTDWGGITLAKAQFLQAWFMFWIFVLEIPTGVVADYFGRKWSLILGALIFSLGTFFYGLAPNFYYFLIGEFILAAAVSLISGADQAWVFDYLKSEGRENESKKVFGNVEAIHLFGLLIGAPIGSMIAQFFSLNSPMLFTALPAMGAVIVGLSLKEPVIKNQLSESTRYLDIVKDGISYLKNNSTLKKYVVDVLAVASSAYFVIWFYQPLLQKQGIPISYFGFFHAGLVVFEIIISKNFERIEKLFSFVSYEKISAFFTTMGFLLVAIFPSLLSIIIFLITSGGFGLTRLAYMSAKINHHIPTSRRATILSSISMFRRFALVIINPFVGLVATNSLNLALILVGLLPLISLTIYTGKLGYNKTVVK